MKTNELAAKAQFSKVPMGEGRIIYVAGCYRAKTEERKRENVWHATRVSIRLWELGWIVFSPINNCAYFDVWSNLPDEVWLNGGLKFLEFCSSIFMLSGWQTSKGAQRELEVATERNMDILYE